MHAGPLRDVLTLLAGIGTGALSAAFGVGGAVVSTPAIRALGASAAVAVGTTLPSILPSAVTGTVRYSRERLIDWRIVVWTVPAGVAASVGGSLLSDVVPGNGHWLMVLTAALLGLTAWRMAQPTRETTSHERHDGAPVLLAIGAAAGLLSGLLGVGGGIVMVPAFTEIAGVPIKTTVATSLVCVGLFAVPGTVTHALLGGVDWRFALFISVGVIPARGLGAAAASKAADVHLRRAVALFLGVIAIVYATGELLALFK